MEFDFSGYATKNDLKCTDGRIIRKDAFKDNDGQRVPLVWQHMHNDPANVLGHAVLENRNDGVYAYCKLNGSDASNNVKMLVEHEDVNALSIYANQLIQKGNDVVHGKIREVSLVLAGANPDALIDNITIMHSDGSTDISPDEAVIYTGFSFEKNPVNHKESKKSEDVEEVEDKETLEDIWDTLNDKQQTLVYAMISQALEDADKILDETKDQEKESDEEIEQSDIDDKDEETLKHSGGEDMKKNVFDKETDKEVIGDVLSHADIKVIMDDAKRNGSLREAVLAHTATYGIEDIDKLFPDAKLVANEPTTISRDMAWVDAVMNSVKSTPFSRIKGTTIDITADDARAKGYVKGAEKTEEIVKALKRVTLPTTIYKKQKLDRDDVIDITDFDVVSWIKKEMRIMLDEELARSFLIGDGRSAASPDKISEENIRPIYKDVDMYAHKVLVSNVGPSEAIDDIIRARKDYKGSGSPVLYCSNDFLTDMLLLKDKQGRYIYNNENDLAVKLRVSKIVEVPVMEEIVRVDDTDEDDVKKYDLMGIIVNLKDYVVGADRGGQISMFDDFDIDYNQHKYLIETRCSAALVQPKSALVLERLQKEEDDEQAEG